MYKYTQARELSIVDENTIDPSPKLNSDVTSSKTSLEGLLIQVQVETHHPGLLLDLHVQLPAFSLSVYLS
jgi:hypothetical protein